MEAAMAGELDEESLQELYSWIDEIPLSRPKKNITRDFSDGVMAAEIIRHFQPRMVDLHNYSPANSTQQKLSNWGTLNRKVFNKLNFQVPDDVMRAVCNCKPGVVEVVLNQLRLKIGAYMERRKKSADTEMKSPEGYNDYYHMNGHDLYGGGRSYLQDPYPLPGALPEGQTGQNTSRPPSLDVDPYPQFRDPRMQRAQMPKMSPRNGSMEGQDRWGREGKNGIGRHGGGVVNGKGQPTENGASERRRFCGGQVPRTRSMTRVNVDGLDPEVRLLLEEKEQAFLASQETVHILNAKIRRLEHLLHLKDIRIEDLNRKLGQYSQNGHS
ncbi:sperm flagellar protein 1-like isoform X2 [Branchiostoma floridae]|uniref:Sperm flagellar protein 1-like isoform X2 n=1 Tax=Branchiostoma floridae TaxID=7739 RepID=A0A9J7L291_BRAFL|nr:sperm flagellar protein 1-like isoform X2 [Branchiostoma floridae]